MSRDIYSALSGASATWSQIDQLSNNLANASTTGFRATKVAFELVGPDASVPGQAYTAVRDGGVSAADGSVVRDGIPTHFALQGPGWFQVQTASGPMLTRDGSFTVSEEGTLVTAQGAPVLGDGGPIELAEGERITVQQDGRIFGSESGEIGRIALVSGPVASAGGNLYRPTGEMVEATGVTVVQGALEGGNTDPMGTMVELIEASRYFEAYQKAMQASDDLDNRLIETSRS